MINYDDSLPKNSRHKVVEYFKSHTIGNFLK